MFVHSLLLKDKNGNTLRPEDTLRPKKNDRFVIDALVTVRPRTKEDATDAAYAVDFFAKLRVGDGVFIEVVTSSSNELPLRAWKTTRMLSVHQ